MVRLLKSLLDALGQGNNPGGRFSGRALATLRDAGWHAGRSWEPQHLQEYLAKFDTIFPPVALRVLSEFGGLNIGSGGRLISFGYIDEHLCDSLEIISSLVDEPLFPVGRTNIFEDDGLGVLMDESGQMYVDGATGYAPPQDYRIDLIETDIDRFLSRLLSKERIPEKKSWYYSQSDSEQAGA